MKIYALIGLLIVVLGAVGYGVRFVWTAASDAARARWTLAENVRLANINKKHAAALQTAERLATEVAAQLDEIRNERNALREKFAGHDLVKLGQRKPGLLANRLQPAVDAVWVCLSATTRAIGGNREPNCRHPVAPGVRGGAGTTANPDSRPPKK